MIHVGNKEVNNVYVGNKRTIRVYKGDKIIYDGAKLKYDVSKNPKLTHYFYHGKQKVSASETFIPIYFTDYYQREYFYDDHSLRFDIRVDLDGTVSWRRDIPAGDYNLSLGVLGVGVHQYNIEVIQKDTGLRSHRLFNEIWIVDDSDDITPEQTYQIVEQDFLNHNIISGLDENATQEQMTANRRGVTALLEEKHQAGFRKIIFPKNSLIRINMNIIGETETARWGPTWLFKYLPKPILIPTNTTVDLNGSTIKLHPYSDTDVIAYKYTEPSRIPPNGGYAKKGEPYNLMIMFLDCTNSCLCNGILEGDYFERETMEIEIHNDDGTITKEIGALSGGNGEHDSCLEIHGGKYNKLENLTFRQVGGYIVYNERSVGANGRAPKGETTNLNMSAHWGPNMHCWDNGAGLDINDLTGEEVFVGGRRTTSDYVDASVLMDPSLPDNRKGWFALGKSGGVDSPSGHDYLDKISFYDKDKKFIENYISHQPRMCKMPENTKYIRITKNGYNKEDIFGEPDYWLACTDYPEYIEYNNCHFIDNRTCVNPNRFKHFRMYKCDFTRSGQSITPLAIDAEDGGATMQDFYVEECTILERAKRQTGDCTCVGGLNIVFRHNHNMNFESRAEALNVTINDNSFDGNYKPVLSANNGWRSNYSTRIYNNRSVNRLHFSPSIHKNLTDAIKIKNCNNASTGDGWGKQIGYRIVYEDCDDMRIASRIRYIRCNIYLDKNGLGDGSGENIFANCKFLATTPTNCYNLWGVNYGPADSNLGAFYNCELNTKNVPIQISARNSETENFDAYFEKTIFKSPVKFLFNKSVDTSKFVLKDCTFEKDITIDLKGKMKIIFSNCTFLGNVTYLNDGQKNTIII